MTFKSAWMVVLVSGLALSSCLVKTSSDTSSSTASSKATLGTWYVSNHAWSVNLSSGALSGGSFSADYTFSDGSICRCATTMTGVEASGVYTMSCSLNTGGGGSMASTTGCSNFDTVSSPTYSNSGSVLTLCHNGASCINYYP